MVITGHLCSFVPYENIQNSLETSRSSLRDCVASNRTYFRDSCISTVCINSLSEFEPVTNLGSHFDPFDTCRPLFWFEFSGTKIWESDLKTRSLYFLETSGIPLVLTASRELIAVRVYFDQYRVDCPVGTKHFVTHRCDILCIVANSPVFWNCQGALLESWEYIALYHWYQCQLVQRC